MNNQNATQSVSTLSPTASALLVETKPTTRNYERNDWGRNAAPRKDLRKGGFNHQRWADHQEILKNTDGTVTYVAHPYYLDAEDMAQLHELGKYGWKVEIRTESAYNPGTFEVRVTRTT